MANPGTSQHEWRVTGMDCGACAGKVRGAVERLPGVEGVDVWEEEGLVEAIVNGLELVDREQRPFLMNVHLPHGLPAGGRAAPPFRPVDLAGGSI